MLKSSLIILVFILFSSCSPNKTNKKEVTKHIDSILNTWHKDAKNANFNAFFNRIHHDGIYIGTDASEIWSKQEFASYAKPYFDDKKTWNFTALKRNIHFSKDYNTIWFDEILDTWMGTCRGSGILEKENKNWLIKHYVLSTTIPNDAMDSVIKVKNIYTKKTQNNFIVI